MEKVIKLRSLNGTHNDSGSTNLVDFDIPMGNKYNMSKSYVSIKYTPNERGDLVGLNNAFADGTESFALEAFDQNETSLLKYSVGIVKNAQLVSQKQGKLENLERVGVLKHHLKNFEENIFQQKDSTRHQLSQNSDTSTLLGFQTPYVNVKHKASQNRQRELMIPLSDILGLGKVEVLDSNKTGSMRLHLNLRLDDMRILCKNADMLANQTDRLGTSVFGADDITNNGAGALNVNTVTKTALLKDEDHEKIHFIGQPILIASRNAGNPLAQTRHIITDITYDGDGKTNITVTPNIATVAPNDTLNSITVSPGVIDRNTIDLMGEEYDSIELVMATANDMPTPPSISYLTFNTEVDNYNNPVNYVQNYHIEPFCKNLYVCLADNEYSSDGNNNPFDSYEISLNNKPLYDRQIKLKGSVDMDLKMKTFANNNEKVTDITQAHRRISTATNTDVDSDNVMIMCPIPFNDSGSTLLNLRVTSQGGHLTGQNVLFKEVMRKLY